MSEAVELIEKQTKPDEVPTMYIEVVTTGESGYVRDDTRGTPYEETINCAGITFVPNSGKMAEEIIDEKTGRPTGRFKNVPIRYIKDCPYIKVEDQKRFGYEKNSIATNDAIVITKGKSIIKREGDIALFDYLFNVFYNTTAPKRPRTAKAIFKVVEVEKKVNSGNEDKFLQAQAIIAVSTLVIKTGNSYKYKESKIDNILTAIEKFGGDNYSDKIKVLTDYAEKQPKSFLDITSKLENITITELMEAIELDLIRIAGSTAEYVESKKILASIPPELKSTAKKMEYVAELLQTPEYAQAYTEFRAKLEIAQEKSLQA